MQPTRNPREPGSDAIGGDNRAPGRGERRCIVTGESQAEARLIRFALAPNGEVIPDVAAKLPGRGAWVRAERGCVELAGKKGLFARAFKAEARAPDDLAMRTEALLARRCLDQLGLMRRAGALGLGATQVEAAIRARHALILIEARDGADDGREALMRLYIGVRGDPPRAVGCFSSEELGVALGRERVIHACVLQERLALAWAVDIGRLAGFRAIVPASWPDSWRSVGWGLGGAGADALGLASRQRDDHT